jgi:signal transduction histidine kinase
MTASDPKLPEQRWRVVIVDDSADDRAQVRRLLLRGSRRRYSFVEVGSGLTCVRAVLHSTDGVPDCVILDFHLPDAEAPEVLQELLASDGGLVCPVVVVTGGDGQELGRAALRAGAQDFISKAWMTDGSLTRTIENAVERWLMAREISEGERQLNLREVELRAALEQAERAVRARDQLVSLVSHDLKSPLHALVMGMTLLQKDVGEEGQLLLDRMARQAKRMDGMINELVDGGKLHAGKQLELELDETDLVRLVADVAAEYRQAAPNHCIEVSAPEGPLCGLWDRKRLDRVVNNLLSNALKYSPAGGLVQITVEPTQQAGTRWAVLRIKDEGIGISAHDLAHVFHWYARADNARETMIPGTGVGLAASRDIVEQHGGSIAVHSEQGKGATFTVRLPTQSPFPSRRSEPPPSSRERLIDSESSEMLLASPRLT